MTVKVRNLESLPALKYLVFYNVLHICNVRAIPTYRVYRLYDYLQIFLATFTIWLDLSKM